MIVPGRYNGPPESGNGGYTCGLVAGLLGGVAEVTLRSPPPLDRELDVVHTTARGDQGRRDPGGRGGAGRAGGGRPSAVSVEDAAEASKAYAGFEHHAYNSCFVCGPKRADGLRVYAGPVESRPGVVASPWTPAADVAPEVVWAALDCPGGWAVDDFQREGVLLGRMATEIVRLPSRASRTSFSAGGSAGTAASASPAPPPHGDGEVLARARSTWIVPAFYVNRSRSGGMTSSRALPSPGGTA